MKKLKQFALSFVVPVASLVLPVVAAAQVAGGAPSGTGSDRRDKS